jgi:serine/threonine protein kinase
MPDPTTRLNAALEGHYRIEGELGAGGMATVYLAEDLKHDRKVALKVLRPELTAVLGGDRFIQEIKTTAGLQHPHILPLFDSGEADGFLFYVMPFVEGESLRAKLDRERQLDIDEALHIAKAVASALQYAHDRDVIHRDIKPENILLHAGEPVVADFGIALAISAAGGGRMTETGLSLGTPHYMSPEQASADRDLTVRSDVYSLACVLYEMLAGQPPHTGPTAQSILLRILTEEPRPVTDLRQAVPGHVAAVVSKGLEKLPADRFRKAEELGKALDDPSFTHLRGDAGGGGGGPWRGADAEDPVPEPLDGGTLGSDRDPRAGYGVARLRRPRRGSTHSGGAARRLRRAGHDARGRLRRGYRGGCRWDRRVRAPGCPLRPPAGSARSHSSDRRGVGGVRLLAGW